MSRQWKAQALESGPATNRLRGLEEWTDDPDTAVQAKLPAFNGNEIKLMVMAGILLVLAFTFLPEIAVHLPSQQTMLPAASEPAVPASACDQPAMAGRDCSKR
jgi:hypothetical protein